jgi:hypothetical protein
MMERVREVSAEAGRIGKQAAEVRENTTGLDTAVQDLKHSIVHDVRTSTAAVDRRRRPCLIEATISCDGNRRLFQSMIFPNADASRRSNKHTRPDNASRSRTRILAFGYKALPSRNSGTHCTLSLLARGCREMRQNSERVLRCLEEFGRD